MAKLTDDQINLLKILEANGGNQARAAAEMNLPMSTFHNRLNTIKRRHPAATNLHEFVPEGHKLDRTTTLYKDGESVIQWVRTSPDLQKQITMLEAAAKAMTADVPRETPVPWSGTSNDDLCSVYVLTDYHIGQLSCEMETGMKWNTERSVAFLVDWFCTAIKAAPNSERAVLCQLGDFLHFDSIEPVTPRGKNIVDTDARYSFLVDVAIKAVRKIVQLMLKKHKYVHIIMAEGNHDISSSIWLRALFADKYADEKRVFVDNTSLPYYMVEHGQTSLFFHHGHQKKLTDISKTFAGMFRDVFGRTKFSYAHMGHYHHVASKEDSLMIVEQHPSLVPKDAHSARGGYLSNRGASVITYSKQFGEVSRITIRPEMVMQ